MSVLPVSSVLPSHTELVEQRSALVLLTVLQRGLDERGGEIPLQLRMGVPDGVGLVHAVMFQRPAIPFDERVFFWCSMVHGRAVAFLSFTMSRCARRTLESVSK